MSVVHRQVQSDQSDEGPNPVTQKLFSTLSYFFTLKIISICAAIFKKYEFHAAKILHEEK